MVATRIPVRCGRHSVRRPAGDGGYTARHAAHAAPRHGDRPSILSADFARLGEEVENPAAGADWVHFDVMDNHYVPNLTIGPLVCEALRGHGVTAPIDVHLMVEPVDALVPMFARAGASHVSFHPRPAATCTARSS